jgi:alpha-tubulin suppressor-like RCC1 family protein
VSGLASGVSAIATGGWYTCALTSSGGVKCWGANGSGQLGDGSNKNRFEPVDVSGLSSGVIAIATGNEHTCALTTTGGVKCWGNDFYGQLGSANTSSTPVDVGGLSSGVSAIAAGGSHTCALTSSGGVKCWGQNDDGQLGNGTTPERSTQTITPVDVSRLSSGVSAIAAGDYHTCALTSGGGIKCWGWNYHGQLGNGATDCSLTPVDVNGLSSGVSAIAVGGEHTCALLTSGGAVKCWGWNYHGQLGDRTNKNSPTPIKVIGLSSGVSTAATGAGHTCALTSSGGVKCWGANGSGQLGDGSNTDRFEPVDVSGLTSGVSAIAAGGGHTCALTSSGGVKCWGANSTGQLGDGTQKDSPIPVDVSGLNSGVSAIATGGNHTCALTAGGVKCWGLDDDGELGNATVGYCALFNWEFLCSLTPVDVSGLSSGVSAIATGGSHTCALTAGGAVKCWGGNGMGQLGDGSTATRVTPVDVSGLSSGISAIATGDSHTCALTAGGAVKCWGSNSAGELGNGTRTAWSTATPTPVDVSGLNSGGSAIAAGGSHTCVLTSGGALKCWGYNNTGQLGDGTEGNASTPVDVQ